MFVMTITEVAPPGVKTSGRQSRLPQASMRAGFVIDAVGGGANLASYLGVNRSQPTKWRKGDDTPSPDVGRVLLDLDYVIARASMLWPAEVVQDWLTGSNSFLNGARPIDTLKSQGVKPVIDALDAEYAGAYA